MEAKTLQHKYRKNICHYVMTVEYKQKMGFCVHVNQDLSPFNLLY